MKSKVFINMFILVILAIFGTVIVGIEAPTDLLASVSDPGYGVSIATGVMVSTDPMRAAYTRFVKWLQGRFPGADPSSFLITMTSLRLEQKLTAANSVLQFEPKQGNSNTDGALEEKLATNEIFFGVAKALGIQKIDPATKDYGNKPLFHFPDPNYFNNANEAFALETLYQGKFTLDTEGLKRQKNILTNVFRYAPAVQYEAAAGAPPPYEIMPQYGPSMEERGYVFEHPNVILEGDKGNMISIALGAGDRSAIEGVAGKDNIAVLLWYGFKFSGIAEAGTSCGI
ncbi:MAG: hypothetical protein GXO85_02255 [Chlorobi bacterium]|nr:hypothetical protein [Chlorobiota bacterium]